MVRGGRNAAVAGLRRAVLRWCTAAIPVAWAGSAAAQDPPFSDTAGTVFDIIRKEDPDSFLCLQPLGQATRQIWDKRVDGEPLVEAYLFMARFTDGSAIEIAINPEFGTAAAARAEALRNTTPLGQLPTSLRRGIGKFSVHGGDEGFHAGTGQIVVYAGRADQRLTYDHLEESVFHEAVHASWDAEHRLAPEWVAAQQADGGFLTDYAADSPEREDLAETALFAFALLHHPDRFPPVDSADTSRAVPHRIAYIAGLLPQDAPLTFPVGPVQDCEGG
jgi:hypothetical protein